MAATPALLLQLQRSAGNRSVTALVRARPAVPPAAGRVPPVQRCGDIPHEQCPCHHDPLATQEGQLQRPRPAVQRSSQHSQEPPLVVQREPVSALAVLAWCLSGAAATLLLDVIAKNLDYIFARVKRAAEVAAKGAPMVAGPQLTMAAGGGFRGAMDRDRRRFMAIAQGRRADRRAAPSLPRWKFNKCSALLSVLVGCVFGVAGGAVRHMLIQAGKWTGRGVLEIAKKSGIEFGMGKWGLVIAKMGCLDRPLDDVRPKSAEAVRPELDDLIGARDDGEGGMCVAEPEPLASEPEELVCRAP